MRKIYTYGLPILSLLRLASTAGYGQHLQAAGVSGSFNVARLHTGQREFKMGSVSIDPQVDQNNDETGNGITLFGRWQVGRSGWYTQPEVGYVSTLETPVGITYNLGAIPYSNRRIRHLDARLLGGYQSGPLRLFAGPSVGYYLYNNSNSYGGSFTNADLREAAAALDVAPPRIQAAVQVGAGFSVRCFEVNARYEWWLTQYSTVISSQQQSYYLNRNLQQLILEVGFQLYKRPLQGY
ncbi:hypothetical protein [Hymenobacter sp.]|jgi:hypothetical protein|uniref:hypothetical protein n=1 Tax=Hymenobacter sp. TaxID=1898978 RepID=UPI002EDA9100